jgi:hypothetical protein
LDRGRDWQRSAWKTNRLDDHDVVARPADIVASPSIDPDWWLLGQAAQILIMMGLRSFPKAAPVSSRPASMVSPSISAVAGPNR